MEKKTKRLLLGGLLLSPVLLLLPTNMKGPSNAQFANTSLPPGIRNNNPGCLRITDNQWQGKVRNPLDTKFESFDTMSNGVRAALRNAYTQWNRGKDTIEAFISTWAPARENNTVAYVAAVAKKAGIPATKEFKFGANATTAKIMYAIFEHECGAKISQYVKIEDITRQLGEMWPHTK